MRCSVGLVVVLALVALPETASAQDGETATSRTRQVQEEPALELKLDDAGVGVTPKPRSGEIEKLETGIRRAKLALGVSAVPIVAGGLLFGISYSSKQPLVCIFEPCPEEERDSLRVPGAVVLLGGVTWMIVAGTVHSVRRRKLRRLQEANYGTPRRVQWDLARSRLVF